MTVTASANHGWTSDPWWIYTTCNIFWVVKTHYNFGILELVRECPRFGLILASMCLSIVFIVLDVISVTGALKAAMPLGINPFWKVRRPPRDPVLTEAYQFCYAAFR